MHEMNFLKLLDLQFSDFAILSILLAILYFVSAIEWLATRGRWNLRTTKSLELRKAASWAFVGIFSTVIAGIVADALARWSIELPLICIPLFFISYWFYFHRRSSDIVQFSLIVNHFDEEYERKIAAMLKDSDGPMRLDAIARGVSWSFGSDELLAKISHSVGGGSLFVAIEDVAREMLPTEEKIERILDAMCSKRFAKKTDDGYEWRRESA